MTKLRSYKKLINLRVPRADMPALAKELGKMQDRPVALVAATLVEDALQDLLLANMKKLSNTEHADLFSGVAPLASFAARIRIASAFRLIDKETKDDLTAIREIRNLFAHVRMPIDFDTPEIVHRTERLHFVNLLRGEVAEALNPKLHQLAKTVRTDTSRDKFLAACLMMYYFFPGRTLSVDVDDEED